MAEQGGRVCAEVPWESLGSCLRGQLRGQFFVPQAYGLYVVQVQVAEGVQGSFEGVGRRLQLGCVQGRLACFSGRAVHQFADELA
jgi:hypothetical protein